MARPRTPLALARLSGSIRQHPGRFRGRSDPQSAPLGEPPEWMSDPQRAAWHMFRCEIPWLMESDRALVEIASYLRARVRAGEEVGTPLLNLLRLCMAQMGATPADRSKVAIPDEPDDDPAAQYFS